MTVPVDVGMHFCTAFRITSNHPNNGNCIQILIEGKDGDLNLSLFGLPTAITERLLHEFSDDETTVNPEVGLDLDQPTGEST